MVRELTLYSRPGCILCAQVRNQLESERLTFREVVVKDQDDQIELLRRAGAAGFPALFWGDRYVGGFTHVIYLLTQGRLQSLVERG